VPEKLSLLYPKTLAGRLELFSGLRANVEVSEARAFASEKSIEEARQLCSIMLRLEALCALDHTPDRVMAGVSSPPALASGERLSLASARKSISGPLALGLPGAAPAEPPRPNPHLGPLIRENMTEDELIDVVASMTTRIENCLSTFYLKQLGGFSTLLSALEQAARMDPNILLQAVNFVNAQQRRASQPQEQLHEKPAEKLHPLQPPEHKREQEHEQQRGQDHEQGDVHMQEHEREQDHHREHHHEHHHHHEHRREHAELQHQPAELQPVQ